MVISGVSPESLGGATALAFARHAPASLILASRTKSKLETVAKQISEQSPGVKPHLVVVDLGSQASVRDAAKEVSKLVDHIDILVNNAAVTSSERRETVDGLESQFGTNYVGPFLFTHLLTPLLKAASSGGKSQPGMTRVVNVSSDGYKLSPIRFHDYNFEGKPIPVEEQPPAQIPSYMKPDPENGKNYYGFTAYGQSKTANILHAASLRHKLGKDGVQGFAVHPGTIWTDLSRSLNQTDLDFIKSFPAEWKTPDQGIATIMVAALDPKLAEQAEMVYLSDCQLEDVSQYAKDSDVAEKLWELSEKLTGVNAKL